MEMHHTETLGSVEARCIPSLKRTAGRTFCSIQGQSTDIRVTNHHRMLYDNKRLTGWKFKEAQDLADLSDGAYLPVCGHGSFKGVPLTDDEIRFIGWAMTDGSIDKSNNAITITQASHQPWIDEIQKCIDGCNLKYGKRVVTGGTHYNETSPRILWTISKGKPRGTHKDRRGWGYLEGYISKDLSPMLFDMDERQFDVLMETVHLADGAKQEGQSWVRRSYHISKGNKTFIERLQAMAIMRGYRASVSCWRPTNTERSPCTCSTRERWTTSTSGATRVDTRDGPRSRIPTRRAGASRRNWEPSSPAATAESRSWATARW